MCPRCSESREASRFVRGTLPLLAVRRVPPPDQSAGGTVFDATKLPLMRWFLAMQLLTQAKNNVSALELKRQLGVYYPSAWFIKHKLMQAMCVRESSRKLDGPHRIRRRLPGRRALRGKPGRGSQNKVPIVAAVQTDADRPPHPAPACAAAPSPAKTSAMFAPRHLTASATVVSDGLRCFVRCTRSLGAAHERIVAAPAARRA